MVEIGSRNYELNIPRQRLLTFCAELLVIRSSIAGGLDGTDLPAPCRESRVSVQVLGDMGKLRLQGRVLGEEG